MRRTIGGPLRNEGHEWTFFLLQGNRSIAHVGFAVVLRDHDQIHGFLMLCTLRRIMLCTQGTFITMIPASQKVKAPRLAVHRGCCCTYRES